MPWPELEGPCLEPGGVLRIKVPSSPRPEVMGKASSWNHCTTFTGRCAWASGTPLEKVH